MTYTYNNMGDLWDLSKQQTNEQYLGDSTLGEALIEYADVPGGVVDSVGDVLDGDVTGAVVGILARRVPGGKTLEDKVEDALDATKGIPRITEKGLNRVESHLDSVLKDQFPEFTRK
ncbi:hypothetical protein ACJJIP_09415 [Microbulbifer sp. VTAC004]